MFKGKPSSNSSGLSKQRTLLFHIGHHKTGSTTIQDALATGRVLVKGKTILYPCAISHNYLRKQFDNFLASGKPPKGDIGFPNLEEISQKLQNEPYDVAVLSGEDFEFAKPDGVQKVLAKLMLPHVTDHKVICYVRPHAGRIMSSYAEQMKLGLDVGTPDTFFEKARAGGRFHYHPKLMKWASTFGENFKLRPMIRSELAGGSVLVDFLETGLGSDFDISLTQQTSSNESLSLQDLMMLKLVHRQLAERGRQIHHRLGWNISILLTSLPRQDGPGTKLTMHKELAEKVRAAYLHDADDLDARFFGGKKLMRNELDRAVDVAPSHAQSVEPEDHLSPDAIRAIAVLAHQINLMLEHSGEFWPKFLLNQRVEHLHGSQALSVGSLPKSKPKSALPVAASSMLAQAAQHTPFRDFANGVPKGADAAGKDIPKIIWLFWHSGFDTAPDVVRRSLKTWQHFNPDYDVRALDLAAANKWLGLDLENLFKSLTVEMGWAGKSDLLRLMLLARYGGVWADATTFCLKPLSEWLPAEASSIGFFSFRNKSADRDKDLRSWFMASAPGNPIIANTLAGCIPLLCKDRAKKVPVTEFRGYRERYNIKPGMFPDVEFVEQAETKHKSLPYFWMFYVFQSEIEKIPGAFDAWMQQSNRCVLDRHDLPLFARAYVAKHTHRGDYQNSQFYKDRVAAVFDGDNVRADYRASDMTGKFAPYAWQNVRRSLQISEARKVIFVHIPKCGGTSIESSNLFEDGVRRYGHPKFKRYQEILGPRISEFRVLATVRNPWDRLASAFFHASLVSSTVKNADSDIAKKINAEFAADFARFILAFISEPKRFLSYFVFVPSVAYLDPRKCEIPFFVQKLEDMQDISAMKDFLGFAGLEIPHLRKGPMREKVSSLYTPETFKKVGQIYRDDVEAFGYQNVTLDDLQY